MNTDKVVPGEKWKFDENVTACFDDMLARSIPDYAVMRKLVTNLSKRFINNADRVVDLGASRGEAIAELVNEFPRTEFLAIEVSNPMAEVLKERFVGSNVVIDETDLRVSTGAITARSNSLVLSILTLQFIPMEYRQGIVEAIYKSMPKGGAFILVEKILGNNAVTSSILIEEYHLFKQSNGYSYEDIERKRAALEGVLVPITYGSNMELLKASGFVHVDCFWRHLNFCGFLCIK
jgi:tRNA (cmo5U34)-methyltransferase